MASTIAAQPDHPSAEPDRRQRWLVIGGGLALVALLGLGYGFWPQARAAVTVTGAYIREPASADVASGYFTVHNGTGHAVTLTAVHTDASTHAHVMTERAGTMSDSTLEVPAHSTATLTPGSSHLMLEHPSGLTTGAVIAVMLMFSDSSSVTLDVPVLGLLDPAPSG